MLGGNAAGAVPFIHGDVDGLEGSGGLVDAVCFGDGIAWLQEVLKLARAGRRHGQDKERFLLRLARELPGTYVPGLYRHMEEAGGRLKIGVREREAPLPVKYRREPPEVWLGGYDGGYVPFVDGETEETLPLTLGCRYRCRFCQSGWMRGAPTETGFGLKAAAARLKAATAASDLNLLASDACSVEGLAATVSELRAIFPRISIKSVALASLARDRHALDAIRQIEKREFTFGVEGISARLRAWLGKDADPCALPEVVRALARDGLRQLKLFFIATGLETEADVEEFEGLLRSVRSAAPFCRLIVSFTPLFNAPFTPLQFGEIRIASAMAQRRLQSAVEAASGEFRWSASGHEIRLMSLFCRAGRAGTRALVDLSVRQGGRFYDSVPEPLAAKAEALLRQHGIDVASLESRREESDALPWDDLEGGTPRHALWRSFVQAGEGEYLKSSALQCLLQSSRGRHGGRPSTVDNRPFSVSSGGSGAVPTVLPGALQEAPYPAGSGPRSDRSGHPRMRPARRPSSGQPAAPRDVIRHAFWAWLEPADAWRPDATLARGLLRDLFTRWPDGAVAYRGSPALVRPAGSSGLALLKASFFSDVKVPDLPWPAGGLPGRRGILDGPLDSAAADEIDADPVFAIQLNRKQGVDPVRNLLRVLARKKVPFQTVRNGDAYGSVVGSRFRNRTGFLALREGIASSGQWALCRQPAAEFGGGAARGLLRPGIVVGIFRISSDRCVTCGAGGRLILMKGVNVRAGTTLCVDCLLRPAPPAWPWP